MLNKNDLSQIGVLVTGIMRKELQKELKPIKKDLKKIHKELQFAIGVLDQDRVDLERRFDKHLADLH